MNIVSLIASYTPTHQHLPKVLEELKKYSSKTIVFTTEPFEHPLVNEVIISPKSVKDHLVYEPRKWIKNNVHLNFDMVLYNEDDILIPIEAMMSVLELSKTLPIDMVGGFVRYEVSEKNGKRYIDLHPINACHRYGRGTVRQVFDSGLWEPWNFHSGNFIFSKKQIEYLIERNFFETHYMEFGDVHCGPLESGASALYKHITKVYPHPSKIEQIGCWHLPNKYIDICGPDRQGPNKEELIEMYEHRK